MHNKIRKYTFSKSGKMKRYKSIKSDKIRKNLTTRSDIIFKNIFGKEENIKLLESLLESIVGDKIKVASTTKSKELDINNVEDKVGILDVQAVLNDGTIVNIEMQNEKYADYQKRMLFYASKLLFGQVKKKNKYEMMKDVIIISILNYEIPWIKNYISKYEINSINENDKKIQGLTLYFIQLPRFEKEKNLLQAKENYEEVIKSKLDEWCVYFLYKNKELLDMVKVKNMDIEEAVKLYGELQEREDVVNLHFSRTIAEMDMRARVDEARRKAKAAMKKANKQIENANKKIEKANEEVQEANKRANEEVQEANKRASEEVQRANKRASEEIQRANEEVQRANERASEEVQRANERVEKAETEAKSALKLGKEKGVQAEKEEMIKILLNQNVDKEIIMKAARVDMNRLNQIIACMETY